jgi:hypothetical protein
MKDVSFQVFFTAIKSYNQLAIILCRCLQICASLYSVLRAFIRGFSWYLFILILSGKLLICLKLFVEQKYADFQVIVFCKPLYYKHLSRYTVNYG